MNDRCAADALALAGYVAPALPLVLDVTADITCETLVNAVGKEIALLVERRGHAADLILRSPTAVIEPFTVVVNTAIDAARVPPVTNSLLTFVIGRSSALLQVDIVRVPARICDLLLDRLDTFFPIFSLTVRGEYLICVSCLRQKGMPRFFGITRRR